MIVDASVAAKWFLRGESHEKEALACRKDFEAGNVELTAPSLIMYEVGNSIWKRKDISGSLAANLAKTAADYLGLIITQIDGETAATALGLARTLKVTFYDASYLSLAQRLKKTFITADEQLLQKLERTKFKAIHLSEYS